MHSHLEFQSIFPVLSRLTATTLEIMYIRNTVKSFAYNKNQF